MISTNVNENANSNEKPIKGEKVELWSITKSFDLMIRSWLSIFRPLVDQNGFKTEDSACSYNVKNLKTSIDKLCLLLKLNVTFPILDFQTALIATGLKKIWTNFWTFVATNLNALLYHCSIGIKFCWASVKRVCYYLRCESIPPYSKNLKPKIRQIAAINFILKRKYIVAFSKKKSLKWMKIELTSSYGRYLET